MTLAEEYAVLRLAELLAEKKAGRVPSIAVAKRRVSVTPEMRTRAETIAAERTKHGFSSTSSRASSP